MINYYQTNKKINLQLTDYLRNTFHQKMYAFLLILVGLLLLLTNSSVAQTGTYTLTGEDSFGDGWGGEQLIVTAPISGDVIYDGPDNLFNGSISSITFNVADGETVMVCETGVAGAFSNEVSYFITDPNNVVVLNVPTGGYTGPLSATTPGPCFTIFGDPLVVTDTIPPTIVCPADMTLFSGSTNCGINLNFGITADDANGPVTVTSSPSSGSFFDVGQTTVTSTATDPSGNQSTCTFNVTILDTIPPNVLCVDDFLAVDPTTCEALATNLQNPVVTEACAPLQSLTNDAPSTFGVGSFVITWTAIDSSGNIGTCTQNLTVVDNTLPSAVCQDVTASLDANGIVVVSGLSISDASFDTCGPITTSFSIDTLDCTNLGDNSIFVTVTDGSNNSSTCSSIITVVDDLPPTVICNDITLDVGSSNGMVTISTSDIDNGSTDNCGIQSLVLDNTTFNCADVGSNSVVLTVTDVNGNSSSCAANVEVIDTIPPSVTCMDISVELDENGLVTLLPSDIGTPVFDICGFPTGSEQLSVDSFDCLMLGVNTIEYSVTDVSGNIGSCTATVTVEDNIPPVAMCQDITVTLDANGNATIAAADIDNGSSDNCSIVSTSVSLNNFTCTEIGANTVTLTVTDAGGNVSTCDATVTVEDDATPTAICQDISVSLDANGNATIIASDVDNGSSDNCSIVSTSVSPDNFTCSDIGANTVTLTVTDASGNVGTCTATVTVEDNEAPTAVCQDVTVVLDANGNATIAASDIDNGSSDNCSILSSTVAPSNFTCSDIGANTVTLTITDANGNVSTCTATATVESPTSGTPTITCPADLNLTYNGSSAQDAAIQSWLDSATASGICGGGTVSVTNDYSASSFSECDDFGTQTVTFTSGSISCTATVTVDFVQPDCIEEGFENSGLSAGDFVSTQLPGVTVDGNGVGTTGNMAMIFDSANPTGGDTDLASATEGLILIISEDGDSSDPDDEAQGGTFTFDFDTPQYIEDIGFLDIENPNGSVRLFDASGNLIQTLTIPTTGDGGAATLMIATENVSKMEVQLMTSGAITDFCTIEQDLIPICETIACMTAATCETEGFEGFSAGTIIDTQIAGLTVSGAGNSTSGNMAMIFDSANPTGGDTDLATVNEGMILIISEDGDSSDPDDDAQGGTLTFDFDTPQFIDNVTLLDIQTNNATVDLFDASGTLISSLSVPNGGNGNIVNVIAGIDNVSSMEVYFPNSGAVVDFCTYESGSLVACPTETCDVQVLYSDFETGGFGVWTDGGSDASRLDWGSPRAKDYYAVRLRDNSNSSNITSQIYDLSTYSSLTLDFTYYAKGTEYGDDFFFEVSTNGGSSFTIIDTWVKGTDFSNNVREYENITFSGPFTNQTVFRFRNDMTNNSDKIFLDNILIDGCTTAVAKVAAEPTQIAFTNDVELTEAEEEELANNGTLPQTQINTISPITEKSPSVEQAREELKVFPNPVRESLNIIGLDANLDYEIINISGAVISRGTSDGNIDTQNLESGTYILRASDGRIARFIKI